MKKVFLLIAIIAALAGCKKHASSPKQFLLTKVIRNGQVEEEYVHDKRPQLIEVISYSFGNGAASTSRNKFVYDANGNLKESNVYSLSATQPTGKYVYKLDGAGRMTRMSVYSLSGVDSGKLSTHIDNEFNANNRVTQQVWKDEKEKATSSRQLSYYANGNLKTEEAYTLGSLVANKLYTVNYGLSDTTLPATFYQVVAYPVNFYYNELVSPYSTTYTYENNQLKQEIKEIMSDRKYNSAGLVVQQTITTKKVKPAGPDEVRMMQYEYKAF
jgi:hypothetical protein